MNDEHLPEAALDRALVSESRFLVLAKPNEYRMIQTGNQIRYRRAAEEVAPDCCSAAIGIGWSEVRHDLSVR
jgi:hypothetical protein